MKNCTSRIWIALPIILMLAVCAPAAWPRQEQPTQQAPGTQQREPWNIGERPPNWTGTSSLEIVNHCKRNHVFEVLTTNLPFVQFLADTHNVSVPGHKSKNLPVQFATDAMSPGQYNGQVIVHCIDCPKEPTCTQDREYVPVQLVVTTQAEKPPQENQPATERQPSQPPKTQPSQPSPTEPNQPSLPHPNPPAPPSPPTVQPPPGREQSHQDCEQGVEEPAPDLLSLLRFKGYSARITDLSAETSRGAQTSITSKPQFQALQRELHKKGYSFPEGPSGTNVQTVELRQGNCSTHLTVGRWVSNLKPDGTMAGITVAVDDSNPDRSLYLAHVTNVYALQPEEMPPNNPGISFNHEPWFTVQIGEAPPTHFVSPFWPIIWYRYWWYDSHRHVNWWYGCYQWWWWRYHWYGKQWFWWYNWWWGYYYWWNWDFWSTWWAPYGPSVGFPPE
jgi:hypothetical protein